MTASNTILLPFLFILVGSLGFGLQSSNAGSNQTQNESEEAASMSNNKSKGTDNLRSPPTAVNDTQQSPPPFGCPPVCDTHPPLNPRIKVTFNNITVHDDHDHCSIITNPTGTCSGGGEWRLLLLSKAQELI